MSEFQNFKSFINAFCLLPVALHNEPGMVKIPTFVVQIQPHENNPYFNFVIAVLHPCILPGPGKTL